jgi:hypothetical protein
MLDFVITAALICHEQSFDDSARHVRFAPITDM